ncbi:hypothetical protein FG386_002601 [Cryptosporidium ryanae]|uniref:uncharacterized protein n=1 Tax=Cryptosporidium ryanae TaxID=515981 RepID=UPI00351A52DB|nr:hypothetical protein FG386_002601 [Cryptosporidium ryanae]
MMRQVKIIIYIVILLLGAILFFDGFYYDQSNVVLVNNGAKDEEEIGVSGFEIDPIYDRVLIFLIDSLRVDFLNVEKRNPNRYNHNRLKNINSLMMSSKLRNHIRFYNFKSDFPTLTTFRVKALMTGENPGFLELGNSLNPQKTKETSNILSGLKMRNGTSTILGDETWSHTFGEFITNDYKYSSFNVFDFDSLDNYVYKKSKKYLDLTSDVSTKYNDWKLLIMHLIGVDHIGHAIGNSDNEFMAKKLLEFDNFAKDVILKLLGLDEGLINKNSVNKLEFVQIVENYINQEYPNSNKEKILFLLFGDHGQNDNGGHGGPDIREISSGFFAFSTLPFKQMMDQNEDWYGPEIQDSNPFSFEKRIKNIKIINQVDIVPVLSSSLGVPIPENNLGIFNSDFVLKYHKRNNYSDQNEDFHANNGEELKELILYAKIIHNNALQLYKKLIRKQNIIYKKDEVNTLFSEFKKNYDKLLSLEKNETRSEDMVSIYKKHISISLKISETSRDILFKDRSKFDWVKIFEGFLIITSLLIFVLISIIPRMDPYSQSKLMTENKSLILFFLISILFFGLFCLIGITLFEGKLGFYIPFFNIITCFIIVCFMVFIFAKFRFQITAFCKKAYYLSINSGIESRWSSIWSIACFLCLVQFCSYSAGFIRNENSIVRFLLSSFQIISLFLGLKSNIKVMLIPIIQLFLLRITYYLNINFGQNTSPFNYFNELFTIFSLILYLYLILFFYRGILNKLNMFLVLLSPLYIWFKWVDNIYIVRTIGVILAFNVIVNAISEYLKRGNVSKEYNNDSSLNNRWITNNLVTIFMLKNNIVAQFSLSAIIQLIEFERINSKKESNKSQTLRGVENVTVLYLTSINNLFNLGVKLDLDSIPGYVGFIGTEEFNIFFSYIMTIYFVTSHLFTLASQISVKHVWNKRSSRALVLSILLSRLLFTMVGIVLLRSNIMVWQLLSPKLVYELLFNIMFSLYLLSV